MTLWARVPWLGQLRRSSLLSKPLLSEDKCYEPFSDSPGVLTESGSKLGEDSVQLASPSGCDGLLAKFANSIVESPRRHACASRKFYPSIGGMCDTAHSVFPREKGWSFWGGVAGIRGENSLTCSCHGEGCRGPSTPHRLHFVKSMLRSG